MGGSDESSRPYKNCTRRWPGHFFFRGFKSALELQDAHLVGPIVSGTGKKAYMVYPVDALSTKSRLLLIPF